MEAFDPIRNIQVEMKNISEKRKEEAHSSGSDKDLGRREGT